MLGLSAVGGGGPASHASHAAAAAAATGGGGGVSGVGVGIDGGVPELGTGSTASAVTSPLLVPSGRPDADTLPDGITAASRADMLLQLHSQRLQQLAVHDGDTGARGGGDAGGPGVRVGGGTGAAGTTGAGPGGSGGGNWASCSSSSSPSMVLQSATATAAVVLPGSFQELEATQSFFASPPSAAASPAHEHGGGFGGIGAKTWEQRSSRLASKPKR